MFWFKHLLIVFFHMFHSISIHHMFWFKYDLNFEGSNAIEFQYIICFGSSPILPTTFKTSVISIHHMFWFKSLSFARSYTISKISIHHMFWFKKTFFSSSLTCIYISIHHMFWFKINFSSALLRTLNFNTSYVLVQDRNTRI
ncbi:hypothetical protein B0F89_10334 [Malaciobacter marinus]|uniref:Secreted protein n=1 Tax=Malaciobacter marinus TaxID=505249 RepID=A0AB36ZZC5_9BACT|nr:hypothetical protein B0F89_10334 [Malaciobacter marinus]